MELVGNFKHLLKQEAIDYMMANEGHIQPDPVEDVLTNTGKGEYSIFSDIPTWTKFDKRNLPFEWEWPISVEGIHYHWWVTRLPPGRCIPIHIDPSDKNKTTRYCWAMQDYDVGHLLVRGHEIPTHYKAGDFWLLKDPLALHGAANLGYTMRLMLFLTLWHN